jgi:hypothetical protein
MKHEKKPTQPVIGECKGKPVLRIPLVDELNPPSPCIVAFRPDYVIEVRQDVLDEEDGPMLKHGLVELIKKRIILPSPAKLSPDRLLLEKRYEEFRAVR